MEELEEELRRGRMKGKVNELWALLGAVNASKERSRNGIGEWAVVDEEGLAQLTQVSKQFQCGDVLSISACVLTLTFGVFFLYNIDSSRSTGRFIAPDKDPAKSIKRCWHHHGYQLKHRTIRLRSR